MEAQVERFAPGFSDRILARHVLQPRRPRGAQPEPRRRRRRRRQLPAATRSSSARCRSSTPYSTPLKGLFIGSAARSRAGRSTASRGTPPPAPRSSESRTGALRGVRPVPVAQGQRRAHRPLRAGAVRAARRWAAVRARRRRACRPTSARARSRSSATCARPSTCSSAPRATARGCARCSTSCRTWGSRTSATRGAGCRSSSTRRRLLTRLRGQRAAVDRAAVPVSGDPAARCWSRSPSSSGAASSRPTSSSRRREVTADAAAGRGARGPQRRRRPAAGARRPTRPRRYLLYFGALQPWQGVDTALRAFARLRPRPRPRDLRVGAPAPREAVPQARREARRRRPRALALRAAARPSSRAGASTRCSSLAPLRDCRRNVVPGLRAAEDPRVDGGRRAGRRVRPARRARADHATACTAGWSRPTGRASWPARSASLLDFPEQRRADGRRGARPRRRAT